MTLRDGGVIPQRVLKRIQQDFAHGDGRNDRCNGVDILVSLAIDQTRTTFSSCLTKPFSILTMADIRAMRRSDEADADRPHSDYFPGLTELDAFQAKLSPNQQEPFVSRACL
jgi:hypothetical protein